MIKVIAPAEEKETTCHQCLTRLSYAYTDMQFSTVRDYGGGVDRVAKVSCTVCGIDTQVHTIFSR